MAPRRKRKKRSASVRRSFADLSPLNGRGRGGGSTDRPRSSRFHSGSSRRAIARRAISRPSEVITRFLDDSVESFGSYFSRFSRVSIDSLAPAVTVIYEGRVPGIHRAGLHATRSRGQRCRRDAWEKVRVQAIRSDVVGA